MVWFITELLITLLMKNLSSEQSILCPRLHSTRDWYAIRGLAYLSLTLHMLCWPSACIDVCNVMITVAVRSNSSGSWNWWEHNQYRRSQCPAWQPGLLYSNSGNMIFLVFMYQHVLIGHVLSVAHNTYDLQAFRWAYYSFIYFAVIMSSTSPFGISVAWHSSTYCYIYWLTV